MELSDDVRKGLGALADPKRFQPAQFGALVAGTADPEALGDIGQHFPDNDPAYAGADSRALLRRVVALVRAAGYDVANVDVTVLAQRPKLAPHRDAMRANIAADLGLDVACVSVKATTTEGLGPVGRQEAIAAHAVCLLLGV